jgi:S-methylmethionine-dependent homocysteine/selenocysteine methylase
VGGCCRVGPADIARLATATATAKGADASGQ